MTMTTTKEHWRIKVLHFGGDGWRWHLERNRPAEFHDAAKARETLEFLRAFKLGNQATAEVVQIPEGTKEADKYLRNIEEPHCRW